MTIQTFESRSLALVPVLYARRRPAIAAFTASPLKYLAEFNASFFIGGAAS